MTSGARGDDTPSAAASPGKKRALPPVDFRIRNSRPFQVVRRVSLGLSLALTFALPLWHLRALARASSGLSGGSTWAALAQGLGLPAWPPPLVGAPWTLRIFGVEFLDPLAGVGILLARGGGALVLWGLLPTVILVALLGRFFCAWLCPYAVLVGVSNGFRWLLFRLGVRPRDVPLPRRLSLLMLAATLLATVFAGSQVVALLYPPAIMGREMLRAVLFGGLGAGALVILFAFLFDTFVARAGFCRYVCPGGALFSLLGAGSALKVVRTKEDCTDCTACDEVCNMLQSPMTDRVGMGCDRCAKCIAVCPTDALRWSTRSPDPLPMRPGEALGRRALLTAVPITAGVAFLGSKARGAVRERLQPPMAAHGRDFAAKCIRCLRCAEVCPPRCIRFDSLLDLRGSETPWIDARTRACTLCMKCTQACPTGALVPTGYDLPALQAKVRMGRPVLDKDACLPWAKKGVCRLCYYACPYPDSAIDLEGVAQAPRFHDDRCVGCGLCEEACPQSARAIRIVGGGVP